LAGKLVDRESVNSSVPNVVCWEDLTGS